MSFIVDSDVFIHDLLHTERSEEARTFLDKYTEEISTTALNIMEIGSVLSRKYRWKKKDINDVVNVIRKSIKIIIPNEYDIIGALNLSLQYYLTPIDALMLTMAEKMKTSLVTFDRELLNFSKRGFSVICPEELQN